MVIVSLQIHSALSHDAPQGWRRNPTALLVIMLLLSAIIVIITIITDNSIYYYIVTHWLCNIGLSHRILLTTL